MKTSVLSKPTMQKAPGRDLARPGSTFAPVRNPRQELRGQPGNHTRAGPTPRAKEAPAAKHEAEAEAPAAKHEAEAEAPGSERTEAAGAAPEGVGKDRVAGGAEGGAPGAGLSLEAPAPEVAAPGKAEGAARGRAVEAYVAAFEAPPSRMAAAWSAAGAEASSGLAREQKAQDAALPDFTAKLEGAGVKAVETVAPEKPAPKAEQVELPAAQGLSSLPAPEPIRAPPVTGNTSASQELGRETGQDAQALKAGGQRLLENLETEVAVETSPGAPPTVPLTEGADPLRAVESEARSNEAAEKARLDASNAILQGPGPAQVQPEVLEESRRVPPSAPGALPGLEPLPEMEKVASWKLDADAAAALDGQARPRMEEHLAQARGQLEGAETQRQADREAAVVETQRKVDAANTEADEKQARAVGEARDSIVGEQREVLRQQKEAVDGLSRDSAAQRKEALAEVDARVKADEKQISSDYQQAEKEARQEQRKGEEKARGEKEKAEREAREDESWWDQAIDLVKEAIDTVAKAIDVILTEIKKAVSAILERVKKAALALIEKARQWVNDRLDRFGAWLKKAVTAVLGELFPELTRKINAFIDRRIADAKKAVNAVAEGLKKQVSALVDGLSQALDKIIEGFRAAVKAGVALAQALVSGDWSVVARMLLDGILLLLGIDKAEFYAYIAKIRNSLQLIVDNPGAFVRNLVGAVKQGFSQFVDNILEHLKAGLLQWLFGVVAEAGIRLPERFDLAGVFDLVMQVLGLTLDRLRAKAVKLIGEKNVERIEFVWEFITAAVAGGLGGLWEKAKEFLGNLWGMVVGAAQDWLVTTLVKKAIIKLASLFNPVGAIIQLILTAWAVIMWLKDNAKRIVELTQAVMDSMMEIATGSIGKAANWIEKALAKLVPVAIHLLANIIGLGGVGAKIKELITQVQDTVDQAIDKLIQKVMKFFKGLLGKGKKGGAEAEAEQPADVEKELEEPLTFMAGEEQHRLWVEVSGKSAELMVASTPSPLKGFLERKEVKDLEMDPDEKGRVEKARLLVKNTDFEVEAVLEALAARKALPQDKRAEARSDLEKLVAHLDWILTKLNEYKPNHPRVGTYSDLSGEVKHYTPHHIPPKGLANWIFHQVQSIPPEIRKLTDVTPVVNAAAAAKKEHDGGGQNLSCILIHENTHILKTGDPELDAYRAHHGLKTSELVEKAMKEKGLEPIIKKAKLTHAEDIAKEEAEREKGGEDTTRVGSASTQFYLTELDDARKKVKVEQREHVEDFLASVADVFGRAHYQSREAVKVALAHSIGKDGPPDKQKQAMDELKTRARDMWIDIHPEMKSLTRF